MRAPANGGTPKHLHSRAVLAALGMAALLLACGVGPTSNPTPAPSANSWLSSERISQAIDFRTKHGLRADEPWVRLVAEMPDAIAPPLSYEIPLTPAERAILDHRANQIDDVLQVVTDYGIQHEDEWAGAWQDPATGAVRARFTGDPASHEAALRMLLGVEAKVIVVPSQWSFIDLHAVEERIVADTISPAWLREHGIVGRALTVDVIGNQVEFDVSSARTDVDELLEERYDAVGMLHVISDGTGVLLLPRGDLAGLVVDHQAHPVVDAYVRLEPAAPGFVIGGDMGHGTNEVGRFFFNNVPAVLYTVVVLDGDDPLGNELSRSEPVNVAADSKTSVVITVP